MVNMEKRRCSLYRGITIEKGEMSDWKGLAEFHYRGHTLGPVDKVFVMRNKEVRSLESGVKRQEIRTRREKVGVIVYGMPIAELRARNVVLQRRYGGFADRRMGLRLLNQEMRCISRVVIHPQYRGIGLGAHLVRETLPQAGTRMVEALAMMGRVNPFFERAGMKRYEGVVSAAAERLLEALREVGIEKNQLTDPGRLREAIGVLEQEEKQFIKREIGKYAESYMQRKKKVDEIELAVEHVLRRPVYYLWKRGD